MQLVKHTRYCWLLLTAWWLLTGAGLAQEPLPLAIPGDVNTFGLWNKCAPVWSFVERLDDDAADIGLTRERIQTLAESRLRAARLYSEAIVFAPSLRVDVSMFVSENRRSGAFNIEVSFQKYLHDVVSDRGQYAATWETGSYGIHTGDAGYILQIVSEKLDLFILEYLRVNEAACQ